MPDGRYGRVGLIGDPVAHSLSPAFQQAALDTLGVPVRYELLHTPANQIEQRIAELRGGEFAGVNVTVPHKEAFFAAVDERSEVAKRVGAVNTIICQGGRLYGDNTDVHGFAQSLIDVGFDFAGVRAIVLGAGGASRAVVVALLDNGVQEVVVANRTIERAQRLASDLGDLRLVPILLADVDQHAAGANLLINATAVGWGDEGLPVELSIFDQLGPDGVAYDLTYRDTPFLLAAREHRLMTVDGLGMLVHQGARSFKIWTGLDAPLDVMWDAAKAARTRNLPSGGLA